MCNFQWKRIGCDLKLSDPLCVGVHSPTLHFVKLMKEPIMCTVTDPKMQLQSESLAVSKTMLDGKILSKHRSISTKYHACVLFFASSFSSK